MRQRARAAWWIAPGLMAAIAGLPIVAGCAEKERDRSPSTPPAIVQAPPSGEQIYSQHCAICHMESGHGVPNFQPSLVDNAIVAGDRARLENVIRGGSFSLQDRDNPFGTDMPPFGNLSAAEMEALIDFLKQNFADPGK